MLNYCVENCKFNNPERSRQNQCECRLCGDAKMLNIHAICRGQFIFRSYVPTVGKNLISCSVFYYICVASGLDLQQRSKCGKNIAGPQKIGKGGQNAILSIA